MSNETISDTRIDTRLWTAKARNLSPYVPGEQPQHANLCKLNTNENPFAPSPQVSVAISQVLSQQANALRLYSDPESVRLRQTLADYYQLKLEQVFVGNGSDEVLALVFAAFFMKQRPLLTPDIGYSFYPVYADTFGIELVKIPLREDFSIEVDDYRQPCSGIIMANPNAPTGRLLPLSDIRKMAEEHRNAVIVIDEAYIDFAASSDGSPVSAISLIGDLDNVLVTQTFSKSRALAGLRVGMAFANASLIEALTRMKNSFNSYPLDSLAQAGATASVLDSGYFEQRRQQVIELRDSLSAALTGLGFTVIPSQTNFVCTKPPHTLCGGDAEKIAAQLREQGIIVRHFNKPRVCDYLRITVGTDEQHQRLLTALQALSC